MLWDNRILLGKGDREVYLLPALANRHGLIAGASGTGKTVTLKVLAESFSMMGVPVFLADVKGDLAGMCRPGEKDDAIQKRLNQMGIDDFEMEDFPTCFWDVFGQGGHPVRATVSEMGPIMLSQLLGLTDAQEGVLNIVFRIADEQQQLILDMKDLRAMLQYVGDNRAQFVTRYGNISPQSVGAIQRGLLELENQGGTQFFGEPAMDIFDWIRTDARARGYINILDCRRLFLKPRLYAAFMLFLLSELFEKLPEVGDVDKPRIVFFFDEAHLLFKNAGKALTDKIEQVAKLIRSKGVGVYFITQSPSDIPDSVLAQLSGRVQHALRAYTPSEQKAVRAAASSFRPNPAFSTEDVITKLAVGEALVSFLDEAGVPTPVERAVILPPQSQMGVIPDETRYKCMMTSPVASKYDSMIDRESAYEMLTAEFERAEREKLAIQREKEEEKERKIREREMNKRLKPIKSMANSMLNGFGRQIGRDIARGLFGNILKR